VINISGLDGELYLRSGGGGRVLGVSNVLNCSCIGLPSSIDIAFCSPGLKFPRIKNAEEVQQRYLQSTGEQMCKGSYIANTCIPCSIVCFDSNMDLRFNY
jgi:hypothetical protein